MAGPALSGGRRGGAREDQACLTLARRGILHPDVYFACLILVMRVRIVDMYCGWRLRSCEDQGFPVLPCRTYLTLSKFQT